MNSIVKRLRDKQNIRIHDSVNGGFVQFQLNETTKFICWERWKGGGVYVWQQHNSCLSLKEVLKCINELQQSNRQKLQQCKA